MFVVNVVIEKKIEKQCDFNPIDLTILFYIFFQTQLSVIPSKPTSPSDDDEWCVLVIKISSGSDS